MQWLGGSPGPQHPSPHGSLCPPLPRTAKTLHSGRIITPDRPQNASCLKVPRWASITQGLKSKLVSRVDWTLPTKGLPPQAPLPYCSCLLWPVGGIQGNPGMWRGMKVWLPPPPCTVRSCPSPCSPPFARPRVLTNPCYYKTLPTSTTLQVI